MAAPTRWSELTISEVREYLQDIRGQVFVGKTRTAIESIDEMLSLIEEEEVS